MKFFVCYVSQIERAVSLHFLDDNAVTFSAKRDSAIALDHKRNRVFWTVYDSAELEIPGNLEVSITMAANEQVILLHISLEH